MSKSGISWTDYTLNFYLWRCTPVSAGCKNCLDPDTLILYRDWSWRRLVNAKVGDEIIGFNEFGKGVRVLETTTIEAIAVVSKPTCRITTEDSEITASLDHPFLSGATQRWIEPKDFSLKTSLRYISNTEYHETDEYRRGYIAGMTIGDGTYRWEPGWGSVRRGDNKQCYWRVALIESQIDVLDRLKDYMKGWGFDLEIKPFNSGTQNEKHFPMLKIETRSQKVLKWIHGILNQKDVFDEYARGWLAGIFDAEGNYSKYYYAPRNEMRNNPLRIANTKKETLDKVISYATRFGIQFTIDKHRKGPKTRSARLIGNSGEKTRFFTLIQNALTDKSSAHLGNKVCHKKSKVTAIEYLGKQELIDIQTGARTFFANGFMTHNCYMFTQARNRGQEPNARISGMGERFDRALKELRGFKDGGVIFVNSMSDTYHELVPVEWIQRIHRIVAEHPQFTFLVLTKRTQRVFELAPHLPWPSNLWLGTSIESRDYLWRLNYLLNIPAAGHFLSAEPLLEGLGGAEGLSLYMLETARAGFEYTYPELPESIHWITKGLDWIIVGAESGANRRPFDKAWAREIRNNCQTFNVPFMFKQGSAFKPGQDKLLDGRIWDEIPKFATHEDSSLVQLPQPRLF